jgi:hypothetical protein
MYLDPQPVGSRSHLGVRSPAIARCKRGIACIVYKPQTLANTPSNAEARQ